MTEPIPHWPGRKITLTSGKQVWLAEAGTHSSPGADRRELVLCVHGMTGDATNWTDLRSEERRVGKECQ